MKRREFVALLGGAAVARPFAARAQQAITPVVGFLHSSAPNYFAQMAQAFSQGLKQVGYVEGENVTIEYRWAQGDYGRLPELAKDLVDRHVAVILAAGGTDPAKVAKAATTEIPIVFVSAADPVQTGLVASLSRPAGNVTGVSLLASQLNAKKLDLLRQLVPRAPVVGALVNPNYPQAKTEAEDFQSAAKSLGVNAVVLSASTPTEIDAAFSATQERQIGALVIATDPFYGSRRDQLLALAARYAVPVIYYQKEFVAAGGLLSYGPSYPDGYRQGGVYIGRILKGEKPADLPVMQPTKFELVINLKTAKILGLSVPPTVLALAEEVIE
jgi:putative tryptophan/tyrosine transport system substrate-binding protein